MIIDQSEIAKALSAQNDNVEKLLSGVAELKIRTLELEQKGAHRPHTGGDFGGGAGELTDLIIKSDGLAAFTKGLAPSVNIAVPSRMLKTAIINATGASQPLVAADRGPGIVAAPQRRFTIRDILASYPTSSNMVEFARELAFTSNAGPQGGSSSPDTVTENVVKPESAMTFELASTPVITLAHWIPASRQVLSDSAALEQHLSGRLLYGLAYEEEVEILTGDGTGGTLNGLVNNASAFTGGATNQTAFDTLAKACQQLTASEYTPTAIILNPADYLNILLLKDTTGRYLLGDPGGMNEPRLWGLPVVATNAMTSGQFLVLDAPRCAYIVDREEASVRIAEQHSDFFVKNMVAILAECRVGLVITLGAAAITGALSYAG